MNCPSRFAKKFHFVCLFSSVQWINEFTVFKNILILFLWSYVISIFSNYFITYFTFFMRNDLFSVSLQHNKEPYCSKSRFCDTLDILRSIIALHGKIWGLLVGQSFLRVSIPWKFDLFLTTAQRWPNLKRQVLKIL